MSPPELATWSGALALLATYLLHSTLVIAAVWALQAWAGARLRDWLWKAAFVLPVLTTGAHMVSMTPSFAPSWTLPQLEASPAAAPEIAQSFGPVPPSVPKTSEKTATDVAAGAPLPPSEAPTLPVELALKWTALQAAASLGAGLLALALLLPGIRLRRFLRTARPLTSGELFDDLEDLHRSAGLVRPVHLFEHDGLGSPVAAGWFRRAIYLPQRVHALDRPSRRALLAHELAHHARLDPLWNRVTHLATLTFFFQPLNRLARARTIACAELLADDLAVRWTGDGPGLARCLTEVATWIKPRITASAAVAMVRSHYHGALRARIHRALDAPREVSSLFSVPTALALSVVTWCALPSVSASSPTPEAAIESSESPYHRALRKLQLQLQGAAHHADDSDELLRLQTELSELTRAAQAATSQDS